MENRFTRMKQEAVNKMKICIQCENFNKTTKQCKLCGCFMPAKVLIPAMKCPADPPKW
jgi:hypothetical protein